MASTSGLTLLDTNSSWGTGGGSMPGTLGQDMRTMPCPRAQPALLFRHGSG